MNIYTLQQSLNGFKAPNSQMEICEYIYTLFEEIRLAEECWRIN